MAKAKVHPHFWMEGIWEPRDVRIDGKVYMDTRPTIYHKQFLTGTIYINGDWPEHKPSAVCMLDLTKVDPAKEMPPLYLPNNDNYFEYPLPDTEMRILCLIYPDGTAVDVILNQPLPA